MKVTDTLTSSSTLCNADTDILSKNVLEFDCSDVQGDQVEITEVSGLISLTLRKVAIYDSSLY